MKKHLFLVALTLAFFSLWGQTPVPPGDVSGIWDIEGSPYQIEGDITVPNDSILIIEPGVKVEFQDSYTMFVQGCVHAQGTQSDSIFFTAANTVVGFKSIRYLNTPLGNDSSKYEYCSFTFGRAHGPYPDNWGGAFGAMGYGKISIEHCRFAHNKAIWYTVVKPGGAAAIALLDCSPVIRDCLFENNTGCIGAVLCLSGNDTTIVENNIFRNNYAPYINAYPEGIGGAILCKWNSNAVIRGNVFENNHADTKFGAIFCWSKGNARIENNLFIGNSAELYGGAIGLDSCSSPTIINNTIAYNTAGEDGGGIYINWDSDPDIINTILWGNTADSGSQVFISPTGGVGETNFYYCNVQGGEDSIGGETLSGNYIGCLDTVPLFDSAGDHPYSLLNISPCIDTGTPDTTGLNLPELDIAGNPRLQGGRIDMGAYENQNPSTHIHKPQSSNFDFSCYPNPFMDELTIAWNLPKSDYVRLEIFDITGIRIVNIFGNEFQPGCHNINYACKDLKEGIYLIRLMTNCMEVTKKIVKK